MTFLPICMCSLVHSQDKYTTVCFLSVALSYGFWLWTVCYLRLTQVRSTWATERRRFKGVCKGLSSPRNLSSSMSGSDSRSLLSGVSDSDTHGVMRTMVL